MAYWILTTKNIFKFRANLAKNKRVGFKDQNTICMENKRGTDIFSNAQ